MEGGGQTQKQKETYDLTQVRKRKKPTRTKRQEMYKEALHNTRDSITLVALLIATFTYTAGLNPPGGVHQDGPLVGTSVHARRTAFRVFLVCNNVALFTSLSVVLVLVSVIPFKRKPLVMMMSVAHKAIWVSASFMSTAYVAANVVVMPDSGYGKRKGMDWTTAFLVSVCAGSLGTVFVGLGVMFVRHMMMKRRWRKQRAASRRNRRFQVSGSLSASGEREEGKKETFVRMLSNSGEISAGDGANEPKSGPEQNEINHLSDSARDLLSELEWGEESDDSDSDSDSDSGSDMCSSEDVGYHTY